MATRRRKAAATRKPRRATPKRAAQATRAKEAYIKSLIAHGQAVAVPPGGKLPPGATHELVRDEKGEVQVVRKRFSAT